MKRKKLSIVSMFVMTLFVIAIVGGPKKAMAETKGLRICNGVYIDDINISNMTAVEAKKTIDSYIKGLQSKKVSVVLDNHTVEKTLKELGYEVVPNTYIEDAIHIGKSGNLIKRYKDLKDVDHGGLHLQLAFTLQQEKVQKFVEEECASYDVKAVNASVLRANGKFVYTDPVFGRKLLVADTIQKINESVSNSWDKKDILIENVVVDDIPKYTKDLVQKCNTKLGSFTTDYHASSYARKNNLATGTRHINNTVVYPGEVFSCYEVMSPFTFANGYSNAGAYVNGMVENSVGGGVCQVSTTLYNAVLDAELEIVERAAHSMTVGYVKLSQDAAIAGTFKDLKFKNNLEVPILIEGITNGKTITFNIYGMEYRDTINRRVEYQSVTLSVRNSPKDVIKEDPTQPPTYRRVTQSPHVGYVTELYKIVYENGIEVSRTRVNKSVYNASPRYVTVGTKEDPEKEEIEKEESEKEKPEKEKPEKEKPEKEDETETDKKEENGDKTSNKKPEAEKPSKPKDDSSETNNTDQTNQSSGDTEDEVKDEVKEETKDNLADTSTTPVEEPVNEE